MKIKEIEISKDQIKKIVFFFYLILLLLKFLNGELLFQHSNPPIIYPVLNFTYWIFILIGAKDYIFEHDILKYLLDSILFISCILSILRVKSSLYPILFCISIWLYQFLYFSIVAYQPFAIGLLFPCLPFVFRNEIKFSISYQFGRYFLIGLYFLAGVLKIVNGGIFNIQQMSDSIRMTSVDYMFYNPNSIKTEIMSYFINHYHLSYTLYVMAIILEISFVIGFLTKKYDYHLALIFLTFHFANYMILDIPFTNHSIILLFLLPVKEYLIEKNR